MKDKHLFLAGCVCLICFAIGMICGALIERRHFNFWFPADERIEIQATIERARRMVVELEGIEKQIRVWNEEARKLIIWNEMAIQPRLSDRD